MEYGTYVLCLLVLGAVILGAVIVKLLSVLYNVLKRHLQLDFSWGTNIIAGSDAASQYHGETYTQRSALTNFEELPQPIVDMLPGSAMPSLPAYMSPPPYDSAVCLDKPPTYDEIFVVGGCIPPTSDITTRY